MTGSIQFWVLRVGHARRPGLGPSGAGIPGTGEVRGGQFDCRSRGGTDFSVLAVGGLDVAPNPIHAFSACHARPV